MATLSPIPLEVPVTNATRFAVMMKSLKKD
jgi:hypothetical protein